MTLSKELQIGKAGEHLVCCDLITQGYNAFLADQGLPFDIIVEYGGKLQKIQVRSTSQKRTYGKSKNIYRFGTRRGKGAVTRVRNAEVDCYAFVALDVMKVAYVPISEMLAKTGKVKQTVDFREVHFEKFNKFKFWGEKRSA